MTEANAVGGYRRTARADGVARLDLNEAPREAGATFRRRLLALMDAYEWRRYPDMDGRTAREAAAALYGWDAGGTLVGNGSNELLAAAVRALLPRGGTLVSLSPSFSMYPVLARRLGATLLGARLSPPDFAVDGSELLALVERADLVLLCSPNNPTGGEVGAAVFEAALATGKPVVWDAPYIEFSATDPLPLLRRHANLMVMRSLSKAWGLAGLRVGAMLASPALAGRVGGELLPFGTGVVAAAAYRTADDLRDAGRGLLREIVAEREREMAELAAIPGVSVAPSSANFFLVACGGLGGQALRARLGDRGLGVRDIPELLGEGYVRVTVGTRDEGDALVAAVRETASEGPGQAPSRSRVKGSRTRRRGRTSSRSGRGAR